MDTVQREVENRNMECGKDSKPLDYDADHLDHDDNHLDRVTNQLEANKQPNQENKQADHDANQVNLNDIQKDRYVNQLDQRNKQLGQENKQLDHDDIPLDHDANHLDRDTNQLNEGSKHPNQENKQLDYDDIQLDKENKQLDHDVNQLDQAVDELELVYNTLYHETNDSVRTVPPFRTSDGSEPEAQTLIRRARPRTGCRQDGKTSVSGMIPTKKRRPKMRYKGVCAYYACYFVFLAVIGFLFLGTLLLLHFLRCLAFDEGPLHACFVNLRLGPDRRSMWKPRSAQGPT